MSNSQEDLDEDTGIIGIPVRVGKVKVKGAERTKSRLIVPEVEKVLESSNGAELLLNITSARERLLSYNIFKSVGSTIDVDKEHDVLEVLFNVKEKGWYSGHVGVVTGSNEVLTNLSGEVKNVLGGAESVKLNAEIGHSRTSAYELSLLKPLSYQVTASNVYASAYHRTINQLPSQHTESIRGATVGLKLPLRVGQYSCGYAFDCRNIEGMKPSTPLGIRLLAGCSVKSSLQHSVVRDRTDSAAFPTKGYRVRLSQELAGLGGDVRFLKTDAELQVNSRIPRTPVVLSTTFQAGNIETDQESVPIADRFFLGGPQSVRGYHLRGVGPKDGDASLGGRMFAAAGVHLFSPLPFISSNRFRLHGFATGGSLLEQAPSLQVPSPASHMARMLRNNFAWSYGIGLAVNVGVGRLEFNYCFPQPGAGPSRPTMGLLVGLGASFL